MAINLPQGFNITGPEPIDKRLVLTKAEMNALSVDAMPYDYYFCICKDDGKFYIYEGPHDPDEGEKVGFKPYEQVMDLPEAIEAALVSAREELIGTVAKVIPGALKSVIESQEKDSGIAVDEDGNISIDYNSDHFKLDENKLDLNIDLIQAI